MQRLLSVVTVSVVLLWLAATLHCGLESLPGFAFLSCCTDPAAEQSASPHHNDCQAHTCSMIETGCYRQEESTAAPVFAGLFLALLAGVPGGVVAPVAEFTVSVSSLPAELPPCWQFLQRTALPPRAPSFAS